MHPVEDKISGFPYFFYVLLKTKDAAPLGSNPLLVAARLIPSLRLSKIVKRDRTASDDPQERRTKN